MRLLLNHTWRGEIRELSNIIERAVIFCTGDFVTMNDLPDFIRGTIAVNAPGRTKNLQEAMNDMERAYIGSVLRGVDFNKEAAAAALAISLPTLYRRIKELDISLE